MYLPAHFEETRVEVIHRLIREHPLAVLVTLGAAGLNANHIPLEIDPEPAPFGTLRGHVARANPVWRDFARDVEALTVFQGPQAYISPAWYQTKKETGKVVPTFNYIVVHAYGSLRIIQDEAWLRGLVERLTTRHESGRPEPWKVSDAPEDFIKTQLRAIVGIEMPVTRLLGKWKVSQNRPPVDREGVVRGLNAMNDVDAAAMARLVKGPQTS
ncbi:MAG TPA: FMN-binding negative transcriptional regulator [Methylomirabilota bacterium]|jgi:transcriptional regulator|nr:FMN-binding negative transcriptional regulator [Methylomirabilota bacterium]